MLPLLFPTIRRADVLAERLLLENNTLREYFPRIFPFEISVRDHFTSGFTSLLFISRGKIEVSIVPRLIFDKALRNLGLPRAKGTIFFPRKRRGREKQFEIYDADSRGLLDISFSRRGRRGAERAARGLRLKTTKKPEIETLHFI